MTSNRHFSEKKQKNKTPKQIRFQWNITVQLEFQQIDVLFFSDIRLDYISNVDASVFYNNEQCIA